MTFTYDGDGKRTQQLCDACLTLSYVYDVNRPLPVVLDDGLRKYVWGLGLAYSVSPTGTIQVYHADGLGSVPTLLDPSGILAKTYQTDEFRIRR